MPILKSIRFQKLDQYDNPVFISSGDRADEIDNYTQLKKFSEQLSDKYDTFLPIFHSDVFNFSTIRFKKSKENSLTLKENASYDINYTAKVREVNGKSFVNCYINKLSLVKMPVIDEGKEIIFD